MILLIFVLIITSSVCFADETVFISMDQSQAEVIIKINESIEQAKDDKEKALLYKKLGEFYLSKEDYKNAAEAFISALSQSKAFSEEEKIQMAIYISWGEKLAEAIHILEELLLHNPDNTNARINLARFLSWSNELDRALKEVEVILAKNPKNRDALLIKANVLNWQGSPEEAIQIYEDLLMEREEFDARLPYTYALIGIGDRKRAMESAKILKPVYPYQERELNKLNNTLKTITRPHFDIGYSYYRDSDHNILNRYMFNYGFWLNNLKIDLKYRHTNAKNTNSSSKADELSVGIHSNIKRGLDIGGGLGYSSLKNDKSTELITGYLKMDFKIFSGTMGIGFIKEAFVDTSELIDKGIRVYNVNTYLSQKLTDRWSIYGGYIYRDFSDTNHSHDFRISPIYKLFTKNPHISIGYTFRYLNFDRQSHGGYFDPEKFFSHQLTLYLNYEKNKFYLYMEPYAGYQTYERYGKSQSGFYGGGSGRFGYKLSDSTSLELIGEGSNYAATAVGWRHYTISFKINSLF